ncbi:MAG: hypothetical protein RBS43_01630 [Candidatus Cloacimonas sp.]|nr:hypothetical protein [Candidatus Cloacimonas sp.]
MKRTLLIVVMMLAALGLFGQKGLFGLSYGDSYAVAKELLETNEGNFYETEHSSFSSVFTADDQKYVEQVTLYFDAERDELVAWLVYYNEVSEENIEEVVMGALQSLHDEIEYWDEDLYCWVFKLNENHKVLAGYNWDDQYVAEYGSVGFPQYSEFE